MFKARCGLLKTWLALLAGIAAPAIPYAADSSSGPPSSIAGQVLLPNGKPAARAPVIVAHFDAIVSKTRTDAEGKFSLAIDADSLVRRAGRDDWKGGCIAAGAPGCGPGWELLGKLDRDKPAQLKLAEDLPIKGKLLDQQGRPVVNAEIRLQSIHHSDAGLDGFLRANRERPTNLWVFERDQMRYMSGDHLRTLCGQGASEAVLHTDEQGSFTIRGVGKERSVRLYVTGPRIVTETIYVVTRPKIEPKWQRKPLSPDERIMADSGANLPTVYPATFHHLARPGLTLTGKVVDATTAKPVKGMNVLASVRGNSGNASGETGADGRYELYGLPVEGELRISVANPGGQPYLDADRTLTLRADDPPKEIDFRIVRGVLVTGRAIDKDTGKPVRGWASYLSWPNNPELKKLPEIFDSNNSWMTGEDGRYQLVVPPGPGVMTFKTRDRGYAPARTEDFGFPTSRNGAYEMFLSGNMGLVFAQMYHALCRVDFASGSSEATVDFTVSGGTAIFAKIEGPSGERLHNVQTTGVGFAGLTSKQDEETIAVRGLKPGEHRFVLVRDEKKQLAAVTKLVMPKTGEPGPVTIRLEPAGVISGRLVDAQERPLSQWRVYASSSGSMRAIANRQAPPNGMFFFGNVTTDADGYFRIIGLPAGHPVELNAQTESNLQAPVKAVYTGTLRAGQQLDLGVAKIGGDAAPKEGGKTP